MVAECAAILSKEVRVEVVRLVCILVYTCCLVLVNKRVVVAVVAVSGLPVAVVEMCNDTVVQLGIEGQTLNRSSYKRELL